MKKISWLLGVLFLAVTMFGGKDWKEASEYKDEYTNYVDVNTNTNSNA